MSAAPTITAVVTFWNRERYLTEAVESVLAQHHDVELVLVDDGSTDGSTDIARRYVPPTRLIEQANRGSVGAANTGVAHATGDYVAFCDSDDLWTGSRLDVQLAAVAGDPLLDLVFGHADEFLSPELDPASVRTRAPRGVIPAKIPSAALIRRDLFERVGVLDETLRSGAWLSWYAPRARARRARVHAPRRRAAATDPRAQQLRHGARRRARVRARAATPRAEPSGPVTVFASPFHLRILRVALLPPDRAMPEWQILRKHLDLDTLRDTEAIKLLPLVYRALVEADVDDPHLARLKGLVRRAWYDNQRLFHGVGTALDALEAAGVRAILLKGVPLVLQCYPEIGLRPMADVDVLVEPAARRRRGRCPGTGRMAERLDPRSARGTSPFGEQMLHQVNCQSADGFTIDLHWRYVPWVARDGSGQDPGLWARARPLDVVGHHALSPSPEDLLLLVILHAFRAGWATAPRWIADTTFLVRALGADLDWDRLVERTVSGHLVVPVRDALEFVADEFDVAVPLETCAPCATTPVGRWEHHRYRLAAREVTGERRRGVGELDDARTGWARWSLNLTPVATVRSIPLFVSRRLGLEHPAAIPAAVADPRLPQRESRRPPRLTTNLRQLAGLYAVC